MEKNEYTSADNDSKPKPKPLKPLVRSNNNSIGAERQQKPQKPPASKKSKKKNKKLGFSFKDFLIKFIAIASSVVIIFAMVLNMPICVDTDNGGNISLVTLLKNQKPAAKEGELDKKDIAQNLNIDDTAVPEDFNDGLDLPQLVEGQYSVLFLGFEPDEYNTDIMWVFQFDIGHGGLNILQIPRDTCLPDYTTSVARKFNSIYTMGNPEIQPPIQRVVNAVQENFGIPIDAYVTTTCDDIVEIIDIIGGVPISIDNEIVFEPDKVIPSGDVVLDGNQSVWFIRFRREWLQGDLGRVQNQRRFMAAAMKKLSGIMEDEGKLKLYSYIKEIYDKDLLYTDLSIGDMSKLADFASTISMDNAQVNMVPGEDAVFYAADGNAYSVYSVHKQETIDLLNEYYRPYQKKMTEDDTAIVELITEHQYETYDDTGASLEEIQSATEPVRNPNVKPYEKKP
ncbi:MAG: LCP family protein [Ruminococcus flavefaciens]|nr:LCP family protein [Ruminococcus flavefaciens]MCM1230569.1 LCP family protein [Ruminococcus flavefaciens]